ncbi:hypothetical protein SADUNF_Sadunf19G0064600 [Salix dunnii]|uniref:Uncharacterized protein n=1 Tax=Salix dunnii TaxID=1413687 RepID=A0A835J2C6_9ROSI|nr:hypothetical protein SADUNF_Sadunf19G0064600 [Salix dunnii]
MTYAHIRTRSTTMEARVAALEAANAKTQLILEAIHHLLEEKFTSIDKRLDSIESRHESSDQICTHPSEEDDGDGGRRRGGLDHRERERASPLENRLPFIKMDFPRFNDGDDPIEWIYKAEHGSSGKIVCRPAPNGKISRRHSAESLLSCFIGGLREGIKQDVKLLHPATIHEAMNFAHEVDAKFQKLRFAHPSINSSPKLLLQHDVAPTRTRTESTSRKDMPFKKLTPKEIQYKRQNNLCFYCDEKFVRGHKCARKQILLLDMGYNSSKEEEIAHELQQIEHKAKITACCITAYALYGTSAQVPAMNKGVTRSEVDEQHMENLAITYPYHSWMDDLRRCNEGDSWIISKKQQVLAGADPTQHSPSQSRSTANHLLKFHIDNGLLKYNSRIVLSSGSLAAREKMLSLLKSNLLAAQNRMKVQADKHRLEREFQVGDSEICVIAESTKCGNGSLCYAILAGPSSPFAYAAKERLKANPRELCTEFCRFTDL